MAGAWCGMGVTTVEEVLSVTTAKEVARTTQKESPKARRKGRKDARTQRALARH